MEVWLPLPKEEVERTLFCPRPAMRWQSSVRKTEFLSGQRGGNQSERLVVNELPVQTT